MTLPEMLTLITAGTGAVVTILNALRGFKTRALVDQTHTKVGAMGVQLNGRLAELLRITTQAAYAEGLAHGLRQSLQPCPVRETLPALPEPEEAA
jgi:hypothetical protein